MVGGGLSFVNPVECAHRLYRLDNSFILVYNVITLDRLSEPNAVRLADSNTLPVVQWPSVRAVPSCYPHFSEYLVMSWMPCLPRSLDLGQALPEPGTRILCKECGVS